MELTEPVKRIVESLAELTQLGLTQQQIADTLGVGLATVKRDKSSFEPLPEPPAVDPPTRIDKLASDEVTSRMALGANAFDL